MCSNPGESMISTALVADRGGPAGAADDGAVPTVAGMLNAE